MKGTYPALLKRQVISTTVGNDGVSLQVILYEVLSPEEEPIDLLSKMQLTISVKRPDGSTEEPYEVSTGHFLLVRGFRHVFDICDDDQPSRCSFLIEKLSDDGDDDGDGNQEPLPIRVPANQVLIKFRCEEHSDDAQRAVEEEDHSNRTLPCW